MSVDSPFLGWGSRSTAVWQQRRLHTQFFPIHFFCFYFCSSAFLPKHINLICVAPPPSSFFPLNLSFSSPSLKSFLFVRVETLPRLLSLPPLAPAFNMFGQPERKTPDNKLQSKSIIPVPISVCERGRSELFTGDQQLFRFCRLCTTEAVFHELHWRVSQVLRNIFWKFVYY